MDYRSLTVNLPDTVPLNIPGLAADLRLRIHGQNDQFVSRKIADEAIWEPYETSLVMALLRPGAVFVDVGANIGYFSVLAASIVGSDGVVFAFEPDPENFRLLEANLALNELEQAATAVHAALAEHDGAGQLYLSEDNLGDHQIYAVDDKRESVGINLLNGGAFLRDRLRRLDLLKVDTQGSEHQVMAGLLPLLQALDAAPHILLELTPLSLRQAGSSGRALVELLGQLHQPFWIVDHIEHRLVASSAAELAQWCDDVDAVAGDAGFMNILVGQAPAA
jgi:FkbM family methyltransferase